MSDIAAFLGACLDEDECVARRALATEHDLRQGDRLRIIDGEYAMLGEGMAEGLALHVLTWSPKRALAEIAGKRKLLAMHEPRPYWSPEVPPSGRSAANIALWYCACQCQDGVIEGDPYPCETARLLASPYATHPDYRPEWAI